MEGLQVSSFDVRSNSMQINPELLELGLISFTKNDIVQHKDALSAVLSPLIVQIAEDVVDGKFEEVWNQPKVQQAIKSVHDKSLSSLSNYLANKSSERSNPLLEIIEPTLDSLDLFNDTDATTAVSTEEQYLEYLAGVCSLCIFIQQNWTGPELSHGLSSYYENSSWKHFASNELRDLFSIDGEYISSQVKNLEYMFFAVLVFIKDTSGIRSVKSRSWWAMRVATFFQKLLTDDSTSLKTVFENHMESIKSFSQHENNYIQALYSIEEGLHWYGYHNTDKARQCFSTAQTLTGLNVNLTGVLGVRTKFQTFQTPQLVLQAESNPNLQSNNNDATAVPTTLSHEDDVYFDKPQLTTQSKTQPLSIIDQVILICLCLDIKGRQAKDGLSQEEMMAFVNRITDSQANNNWMVYSMCLLIKARLEADKGRTTEKAALQVQVLVDQFNDKDAPINVRMKHIFQLAFPPRWQLKKELGLRFLNIGAAATALQIFEELQMWEEIIDCYRIMDKTKKAEEIVRDQLAKNPTPLLWCILGDLTNDRNCYETAWSLSGNHIARAQRSLARLCVVNKQWEEAIQHYEIALAINPLFPKCWFTLGCGYMHKQQWDKSVLAFSRVVQIDPTDGEAWNNMASVYIQQKKKKEAFLALQESVKHTRSDWRIWTNMLMVAMDIGEFQAAFQAYHQVLELNKHEIDLEILTLLCKVVVKDIPDVKGFPGRRLEPQLKQLFKEISSHISDWNVWRIMASYYKDSKDLPNCLEYREKQYRAVQTLMGWEHEASLFEKVATSSIELAKDYIEEGSAESISAAKSALRGLLRKTEARESWLQFSDDLQDNFSGHGMYKEIQQVYETILKLEAK